MEISHKNRYFGLIPTVAWRFGVQYTNDYATEPSWLAEWVDEWVSKLAGMWLINCGWASEWVSESVSQYVLFQQYFRQIISRNT